MRYKLRDIEDCQNLMRKAYRDYITPNEEDDDRTFAIKRVLRTLPVDEQALFILHTEIGSYREIAKVFGVSRTTILNKVKEITARIKTSI